MDDCNDKIDFRKLEKELNVALKADAKYSRENSAKFRAVQQRVGSYEEFRDIVLASHLTPLERKDITGQQKRNQPWNSLYDGKKHLSSDFSAVLKTTTDSESESISNTVDDRDSPELSQAERNGQPESEETFMKYWTKSCKSDTIKYEYLKIIRKDVICKLFRHGIPTGLLGEAVTVMCKCFQRADCDILVNVLHAFTSSDRFKLNIHFLSKSERECMQELFRLFDYNISEKEELRALFNKIKRNYSL